MAQEDQSPSLMEESGSEDESPQVFTPSVQKVFTVQVPARKETTNPRPNLPSRHVPYPNPEGEGSDEDKELSVLSDPSMFAETQDIDLGLPNKGTKRGPQPEPKPLGPPTKARKVQLEIGSKNGKGPAPAPSSKKVTPSRTVAPERPVPVTKQGPKPSTSKQQHVPDPPSKKGPETKPSGQEKAPVSPTLPVGRKLIKASRPKKTQTEKPQAEKHAQRGDRQRRKVRKFQDPESLTYTRAIYKVFKEVCPDKLTMSTRTMSVMNSFMKDIFDRIVSEAALLVKRHHKQTLGAREIETAAKLILTGEIARHASSEGTKALTKYEQSRVTDADTRAAPLPKVSVPAKTKPKKTKK